MEGKLVKTGNDYILYSKDKTVLGITSGTMEGRMLSLKNCESIANGYDLIKLVEENSKYSEEDWGDGFLFAINLMSDKNKKLEEFIRDCATNWDCDEDAHRYNTPCRQCDAEKLLQQNEWDVVIEMEKCGYCEGCNKAGMLHCAHADSCGFPIETERPKLDADGCLILKRK